MPNLHVWESKSGTHAGATICLYYTSVSRTTYYCKSFLLIPLILLPDTHAAFHALAAAVLGLPCINFLAQGLLILLIVTLLFLLLLFRLRTFHSQSPVKHQKDAFGHHINPLTLFHKFIWYFAYDTFPWSVLLVQNRKSETPWVWLILKCYTLSNSFVMCMWESSILLEIKAEALNMCHNSCLFYWKWSLI